MLTRKSEPFLRYCLVITKRKKTFCVSSHHIQSCFTSPHSFSLNSFPVTRQSDIVDIAEPMLSLYSTLSCPIFREATSLGKCLNGDDFELKQPRLNARQVHRFNVQAASAEEYFKISLFNEYFSHLISELEARFTNNPAAVHTTGLLELLPEECIKRATNIDLEIEMPQNLVQARELYSEDLPHPVMLHREYQKWVLIWKEFKPDAANPNPPQKLIDVLIQTV